MNAFLKWYYGYKNLWDEILMFGVIRYCFDILKIEKLTIEVKNKPWMTDRIHRHNELVKWYDIELITKWFVSKLSSLTSYQTLKIFGGGEVLCPSRWYLHGWGNLYHLYTLDILRKNFILLWGIGKPGFMSLMYFMMLPFAQKIICRDQESYNIANLYTPNVELYHDFALDILDYYRNQCVINNWNIALLNCNPYIRNEQTIQLFVKFANQYPEYQLYFVPGDIIEDSSYYYQLKTMIPRLQYYDWTQKTILEICQFFASVTCGVWARLHVLMLLHYFGKPFQALVYQDKITKILWKSIYMKTLIS
jgi:polysaccharide pyruvyl transferase WcaK-like protein